MYVCSSVEERHCQALELNYQSINQVVTQTNIIMETFGLGICGKDLWLFTIKLRMKK